MQIGDKVRVIEGASDWTKERYCWHVSMGDSIDGMEAVIVDDYTELAGDDCHYVLDMIDAGLVGVNPQWLVSAQHRNEVLA